MISLMEFICIVLRLAVVPREAFRRRQDWGPQGRRRSNWMRFGEESPIGGGGTRGDRLLLSAPLTVPVQAPRRRERLRRQGAAHYGVALSRPTSIPNPLKSQHCGAVLGIIGLAIAVFGAGCLLPAFSGANTPIRQYSAIPSTNQAGGHPDLEVSFEVENSVVQHTQSACDCQDPKSAIVQLPAGFIGNPHATPQCTLAEFASYTCPVDSQVGIDHFAISNVPIVFNSALYNLVPTPDEAVLLGFETPLASPAFTVLEARTGSDYGLDCRLSRSPMESSRSSPFSRSCGESQLLMFMTCFASTFPGILKRGSTWMGPPLLGNFAMQKAKALPPKKARWFREIRMKSSIRVGSGPTEDL